MLYIILAIFSGCLVITSVSLNALLAKRVGVFRGTLVNYIAGFTCSILIIVSTGVPVMPYIDRLGTIPIWAFCGGLLGVAVVSASNVVITRVPAVYVTLLTFTGQLAAGLVIDFAISGFVSWQKITGIILIIGGIAYNSYVDSIKTAE